MAPGVPMAPGAPSMAPQSEIQKRPPVVVPTSVKMKKFHWSKQSNFQKLDVSVWRDIQEAQLGEQLARSLDFSTVEAKFCDRARPKVAIEGGEAAPTKKEKTQTIVLFDTKREYAIDIGLARFRMTPASIRDAIVLMDATQLGQDKLTQLLNFCPTVEEVKTVVEYLADGGDYQTLSNTGKFFHVCSTVKQVRSCRSLLQRLQLWSYQQSFARVFSDINTNIMMVRDAVFALNGSDALKQLFALVLVIGNFMNGQTKNGQAYGFQLSTMNQLRMTKSFDNKTNLMAFLVEICETQHPDVIQFIDDLAPLKEAMRVESMWLQGEVNKMVGNLNKLKQALQEDANGDDGGSYDVDNQTEVTTLQARRVDVYSKLEMSEYDDSQAGSGAPEYEPEIDPAETAALIEQMTVAYEGLNAEKAELQHAQDKAFKKWEKQKGKDDRKLEKAAAKGKVIDEAALESVKLAAVCQQRAEAVGAVEMQQQVLKDQMAAASMKKVALATGPSEKTLQLRQELADVETALQRAVSSTGLKHTDRFVEVMSQFFAEADAQVTYAQQQMDDLKSQSEFVIKYFGEDPATCKWEDLFMKFDTFVESFASTQEKAANAKLSEEKRAKLAEASERDRVARAAQREARIAAGEAVPEIQKANTGSKLRSVGSPTMRRKAKKADGGGGQMALGGLLKSVGSPTMRRKAKQNGDESGMPQGFGMLKSTGGTPTMRRKKKQEDGESGMPMFGAGLRKTGGGTPTMRRKKKQEEGSGMPQGFGMLKSTGGTPTMRRKKRQQDEGGDAPSGMPMFGGGLRKTGGGTPTMRRKKKQDEESGMPQGFGVLKSTGGTPTMRRKKRQAEEGGGGGAASGMPVFGGGLRKTGGGTPTMRRKKKMEEKSSSGEEPLFKAKALRSTATRASAIGSIAEDSTDVVEGEEAETMIGGMMANLKASRPARRNSTIIGGAGRTSILGGPCEEAGCDCMKFRASPLEPNVCTQCMHEHGVL
jgi:hypothetical protein